MRQKYRILIEDKKEIWQELDLGSDKLAWTCQTNNIAELESRQASYSQNIKLPKTIRNIQIFDYANIFQSATNFQYQRHNCRVYCADRAIAGKGSFLILLKVSDHFECQILSGNAGFFENLKDAPMSDLDLGVFLICNNSMNPDTWHPAYKIAYGIDFSLRDFQGEINPVLWPIGISRVSIGLKYPVVSIDFILRQILLRNRYTLESNEYGWENKYLSLTSVNVEADMTALEVKVHTAGFTQVDPNVQQLNFLVDKDRDSLTNPTAYEGFSAIEYWFDGSGGKVFIESVTVGDFNPGGTLTIRETGKPDYIHRPFVQQDGNIDGVEKTFELYNDRIKSALIWSRRKMGSNMNFTLTIIKENNTDRTSNEGGSLVLSERLGFDTQYDFMKFFAQTFGLTFFVDEAARKIRVFTFQLLYDNIKAKNVRDWSGKLNTKKQNVDFTLQDYARENIISYEDNTQSGLSDSGKFFIDNSTLNPSKELFKLAIEAGQDYLIQSIAPQANGDIYKNARGAEIPLIIPLTSESEIEGEKVVTLIPNAFTTIKPHLIELSDETVRVRTRIIPAQYYDYRISRHVTAQEIVDEYYHVISEKMLKNARRIEADFLLTPEDIEQFDPSIPVYIGKYGAYFYLNKIKNFELGKLTTCELIKL
ncbi:MAG: hypothetical protein FWF52_01190 [Candidatus Azobacteroides sp.]|nr:hypothetical protein [Candidatus Azobacteroides sp.]